MNTKMIDMSLESDVQLRRKFTELDSLYRKSPNGVGVLDRELRYLRVNQAMAEFHGLPQGAFAGHSVHELLPELSEEFLFRVHDAVKTNQPLMDVELTLQNGGARARGIFWRTSIRWTRQATL